MKPTPLSSRFVGGLVFMLLTCLLTGLQAGKSWTVREATAGELAVAERKTSVDPTEAKFEAGQRQSLIHQLKLSSWAAGFGTLGFAISLAMLTGLVIAIWRSARRENSFPVNQSPSM